MLTSFEVANFRAFSRLSIRRLGRVNLVCGKNSVGKTTLLEALRFYAMGSATALREYLADHDEVAASGITQEPEFDFRSLFHGRPVSGAQIALGPQNEPQNHLHIRLVQIERVEESDGSYHYAELSEAGTLPEGDIFTGIAIRRGDVEALVTPHVTARALRRGRYVGPAFVSAREFRESDLLQWWEAISLKDSEDNVVNCLSLLAPIERIATFQDPLQGKGRVFKVRMHGQPEPYPLRSLGGGAVRLFQIALALEYARTVPQERQTRLFGESCEEVWKEANFLLVDEIENGIHYTFQKRLWEMIFRLARELDIQVFATTHSWDCLKGFAEAIAEDEQNDGLAIRLEKIEGKPQTGAVILDREDLPIVAREKIEVR